MAKLTAKAAFKGFMNLYESVEVMIKYDLITSADVIVQSLYIGYTEIKLGRDQDPADKNHFVSKEDYKCVYRDEGLRVTIFAGGMAGGYLELKVSVKPPGSDAYRNLTTYPIRVTTDAQGHLDLADFFKY